MIYLSEISYMYAHPNAVETTLGYHRLEKPVVPRQVVH